MRLYLVVENGKAKGTRIDVPDGGELIVGRDARAGFALPDVMVSRQHFRISSGPDGFFLADLGSQNGTFVNDLRVVKETAVRAGDMIHAGETSLSILEQESKGLVGKEIDGYRILDRVGGGGMGTVFRAEQLSLHREVAFKVLSARLTEDSTFVDLFLREARAAGALNHPHIVQVYDVGRRQGLYYFSMEFMHRGSAQDRLDREGKIPWAEAVKIVLDTARGLEYAQRKGIVHRDIKPDNLMIAEDGTVKIADLGLAHRADDTAAAGGEGILGTPHFISPEQAQGKPVDVRSDLYSLGATFYRMVTGRNPFPGKNVRQIVVAQIRATAPSVHEVDPAIPREVSAVIERLMEKDPADRYQSPAELIEALERIWGNGNGTVAFRPASRWLAVVAAVAVLAAVALFFLLRSDESPTLPGPGATEPGGPVAASPDDPAGGGVGPVAPAAPDPEIARKAREMEAEVAYLKVISADLAVAERLPALEEVAAAHPDTESGRKAAADAAKLRCDIETQRKEEDLRRHALLEAWASAQTKADAAARALRFAEADAVLAAFLDDLAPVVGLDLKPEAEQQRRALRTAAEQKFGALREAAAQKIATEQFDEAIELLETFSSHVAAGEADRGFYTGLATKAAELIAAHGRARAAFFARRFQADRQRVLEGYRKAHEHALASAFDAGLAALEQGQREVTTESYRRRFEVVMAAYDAMKALKAAFIERAGKPDGIRNTRVPLDLTMLDQDTGTLTGADDESLQIEVVIHGQKNTVKRPWSGYPPGKLLALFADDRWDMSPAEHRALAFLALELGDGVLAAAAAQAAGDGTLIAWVERERQAARLYREAREAEEAEAWAEMLGRARRLCEEYTDTEFFVRHSSGATPLAAETVPGKSDRGKSGSAPPEKP
ncbi:MAG: protein kinase [Planctomycetes bacterium]|nr:protein kinase [Planctomycetota bacterium]